MKHKTGGWFLDQAGTCHDSSLCQAGTWPKDILDCSRDIEPVDCPICIKIWEA
jgi:hypothetical protein